MKCRQCGKELPSNFITGICLECSRENLRKTLNSDPELKTAFKETIEDLKRPENIKRMSEQISVILQHMQQLQIHYSSKKPQ